MRNALFISVILFTPLTVTAQGEGGFAAPFLRMGLGARAISMGGAFTAVADDGFAAYYNPAGLPYLTKRHFTTTYSFLSLDRQFHYISYSQSLKPTAGLSLFWLAAGTDNIDGRDLSGNHTFDYSDASNAFGISFANRFHESIAIGITLKIITQNLDLADENLSSNDLAIDAGLMFIPVENMKLGVVIKDLDGSFSWNTQDLFSLGTVSVDTIPYTLHVGASYLFDNGLTLSTAALFNQSQQERMRFGIEYRENEFYSLRAGSDDGAFSFGGGVRYQVSGGVYTNIDYAFRPELVGEGGTHLFSWEFTF
ncbi:MAG: PorV/PorQ family protein [Candidatus Marinimicrobia bacterium]|nr:PorV/PorQ family protein [Candidatus Neomarinimicrobiota bacterium]